nr:hypothetical protein [Vibrio vulnificus]
MKVVCGSLVYAALTP